MPRTNNPSSGSSSRNRGPAKASEKSRAIDAAADMQTSTSTVMSDDAPYSPSYEEIAEAAYQRYLHRGGGDGQDFDDWVEAERDLRLRRTQQ